MRGATCGAFQQCALQQHFNPRSSCEERLAPCPLCQNAIANFNPRSSCEERHDRLTRLHYSTISIHAPHARSDAMYAGDGMCTTFQSTLLMRGATPAQIHLTSFRQISIHAPHARSDRDQRHHLSRKCISIHAPHARSDVKIIPGLLPHAISIHAPHARSDLCDVCRRWHVRDISIHAPHARSDLRSPSLEALTIHFNPRSSCEERPPPCQSCRR